MNKQTIKEFLYQHHTPKSAENYLFTINNFLKTHPKAKKHNYQKMVECIVEINTRYPNPQTRSRTISAIKRYYDYLVFTGQRNDHPCKTLTAKKKGEHSIQAQDLFSTEELESLMQRENRYKNLDIRNKVLISLLIYQGLTSDEILRLEIDNIDLEACTVYVKASSKLNRRTLPLKANQVRLFDSYINQVRSEMIMIKTNRFIISKLGRPLSTDGIGTVMDILNPLFPDRVLNPRSIRMSVISNCLNERKMPLEDVQRLAGHKWPSSTEKYYRVDSNQQRELINRYFPL